MKKVLTQIIVLAFVALSFTSCGNHNAKEMEPSIDTEEMSESEKIAYYHGVFLDRIEKEFPRAAVLKSTTAITVDTSSDDTDWMQQKHRFFDVLDFLLEQPEMESLDSQEKDKTISFYKACFYYMEDPLNKGVCPASLLYDFLDSYLMQEAGVSITDLEEGSVKQNDLKSLSIHKDVQQVYSHVFLDSQKNWTNFYGNTRAVGKWGQYAADAAGSAVGMLFGNVIAGWATGVIAGTMASEAISHWDQ